MTQGHGDPGDRRIDAWLDAPVAPPQDDVRRRILIEVHRTAQRPRWHAMPLGAGPRGVSRPLGAVAGLAVVLVVMLGLGSLVRLEPGATQPIGTDAAPLATARTFALPGDPATLGTNARGVVVALRDGTLVRVDVDAGARVLASLGAEPCGIPLSTEAAVFIAGCDAMIHRVDARTGAVTAFPGAGRQLAPGPDGSVWILDATRRTAVLVDGLTGAHRVEVALNAFAAAAAGGFGRIWIIGDGNARLTALDPTTGDILAVLELQHDPTFGIAGPDGFYAVAAGAQLMDIVDGDASRILRSLGGLPLLPTSAAPADTGVWLAGSGEAVLLDPVGGAVLRGVSVSGTAWVAASGSSVWLISTGARTVTMLEP